MKWWRPHIALACTLVLPVFTRVVRAEDNAHGSAVLAQMMADRPAMKGFVDRNNEYHLLGASDTLVTSAAALLTNDGPAGPVAWSNEEPDKETESCDHIIATDTQPTRFE
jgi:hypothetical protein